MLGWIYLMLALSFGLAASTCLKLSYGFTKLMPSLAVVVLYGLCFSLLALAVKTIDISVAYAVWGGLGTTAVVIIGIVKFKESINLKKVISIGMIITGVIVLELFS